VDAIEERIDLEGFQLPNATEADEGLWSIWQANDLDEESQLAHLDALVRKRSFIDRRRRRRRHPPDAPTGDDRDTAIPLMTVESSDEVAVELSPRTRRVSAAAKLYKDGAAQRSPPCTCRRARSGWSGPTPAGRRSTATSTASVSSRWCRWSTAPGCRRVTAARRCTGSSA
jgi:hypothetical protein